MIEVKNTLIIRFVTIKIINLQIVVRFVEEITIKIRTTNCNVNVYEREDFSGYCVCHGTYIRVCE